jgi:hypothetical protein
LSKGDRVVDVSGIDNHQCKDLAIVQCAAVVTTNRGEVCAIFNEYAAMPSVTRSIHSSGQLEFFGQFVDDKSRIVGGRQYIKTAEGYIIGLDINNGLPHLPCRRPTDRDLAELPHVIMTSPNKWVPSCLDCNVTDDPEWYKQFPIDLPLVDPTPFDEIGEYRNRTGRPIVAQIHDLSETIAGELIDDDELFFFDAQTHDVEVFYEAHEHLIGNRTPASDREAHDYEISEKEPDWEEKRRFFFYKPANVIKKTFEATTQFARESFAPNMFNAKHFRAPNPALNVARRNEAVATDTVMSNVKSVPWGLKMAQIFTECTSRVSDVYGIKTDKSFPVALEDCIKKRGAMDKLISDSAPSEISARVKELTRQYVIRDWQSEPYHQHQNAAERAYRDIKRNTKNVMDRSGAPAALWLLALGHVVMIMNHTHWLR